uniref:Uncharacterized protein n=1 Tax=Timema genevievae TaxID=629358 RepID=A0A7R9K7D5_TIMGE|nr:unnamed protein product [Timema genevievae]
MCDFKDSLLAYENPFLENSEDLLVIDSRFVVCKDGVEALDNLKDSGMSKQNDLPNYIFNMLYFTVVILPPLQTWLAFCSSSPNLTLPAHQAESQLARPCFKLVGFVPDQSPVARLHLTWLPMEFYPTFTRLLRPQGTTLGEPEMGDQWISNPSKEEYFEPASLSIPEKEKLLELTSDTTLKNLFNGGMFSESVMGETDWGGRVPGTFGVGGTQKGTEPAGGKQTEKGWEPLLYELSL